MRPKLLRPHLHVDHDDLQSGGFRVAVYGNRGSLIFALPAIRPADPGAPECGLDFWYCHDQRWLDASRSDLRKRRRVSVLGQPQRIDVEDVERPIPALGIIEFNWRRQSCD